MTGVPRSLTDRSWRPERPLALREVLDELLDDMEAGIDAPDRVLPADPTPLSTGLAMLDRVLVGGIHLGEVTVVEADLPAQGDALLLEIARRIEHPALVVASSAIEVAAWLVAGEAGVPAVAVGEARMSQPEWDRVAESFGVLANRDVDVGEARSLRGVARLITTSTAPVVVVRDVAGLGAPVEVMASLARAAHTAGVAVVTTLGVMDDVPGWALEGVQRVTLCAHGLGGRAALVRPDDD
ncbi:MAG: hypothetical protein JJU45_05875, partial [Acidimicrobiia bacterium]|nr:hypothetical protein [Acidimicrobiia bacterium]